jgi:hypothetical protein
MNNRQHIQKKHPSQSTYTPVQNLYQTRAFDIQQQPSHSSSGQENVDLDADHEQSQYKLYNLPYIPVNAPGTEPPPPIQTQLNSGEPTNYYQQGSADVPWYNRPTYPNIPVNAPGTEPPPPIQTQLNSGEPTNYYQQGSADVAWYNRHTYPNIPVNAPGTEPPPPIQTKLNSGEPTNYYQQGSADVAWYNRPTYPNIPVNAPGTEPPPPIQTKLTIGEPGDKYEQEADQVASQVVQQINSPVPVQSAQGQTVQREEVAPFEEEQVQAKSISDTIQREEVAPFEEEQVQAKSISDTIQRQEKPDLEASINQARGGGQAMGDNIRKPMEQAFGADFGGVKVHTDSRSDQLNQSIQARAFTTGQNVFFRQGEYNPGSRGGQELLAHELTHVVQQNRVLTTGVGIQRKPPRRTEKRILNEMTIGNGSLTTNNIDDLLDKMDKGQSNSNAHQIAAQTEDEANKLVSSLPQTQQQQVRAAIKDYVSSSSAIQTDARNNPNAPNQAVQALDAALAAIRQKIAASNERIVYRSISYPSGADIPYGQADQNGNIINIGDFVGDLGFLSTSEHRQFILGKEQTGQVQGLLKLAIHGKSGVPVAIDIPVIAYSNTNQQALYDMQQNSKNRLVKAWNQAFGDGASAGQAEVLFPRNSVFEVKNIAPDGDKVSVVLEENIGQRPPLVKSMKYGTTI